MKQTQVVFASALWGLFAATAAVSAERHGEESKPMNNKSVSSADLESADPKRILQAALLLAASPQPADQQKLLQVLASEDFLLRLNSAVEYRGDPQRLRLRRILAALAANTAPVAHDSIVALAASPVFTQEGGRVDLLIAATAVVRPAPPQLVAFWDRHSQPDDGYVSLTIRTLIENDSDAALGLFEKKMADALHDDDSKLAWMRSDLLSHRDSARLLRTCERLLRVGLAPRLRGSLVEVLFDYRPGEWYVPAISYQPPPLSGYSSEARTELRKLGDYALQSVELTAQQRAAVQLTLKQIGPE
jgi:hypothetical protein